MLIYEKHFEVENPNNYQERTIDSYISFEEYLDFLTSDRSKELYPSLPRQVQILSISKWADEVEIEFINKVNMLKYIHIGKTMK